MTRKSNMGVSMVEILIAMAIFMILLMPIVSSLIVGMQTTTSAKETQYRNEYARNLMENVKEVPISILKDANATEKYFENLGADIDIADIAVTSKEGGAAYDKYVINGTTKLGTERTQYAYTIEVSGEDYATINDLKSGIVEDMDQTKVALISAPFSNYDYPAYDALLTKKMAKLQKNNFDPDTALKNQFNDDTCSRTITLDVSGTDATGYTVKCILKYVDDAETVDVEYTPYAQTFDKLPNIYLMYNACIYNGQFASSDTLTYNLNIPNDKDLNVFVVATPQNYATDYSAAASQASVALETVDPTNGKTLYRTDIGDRAGQKLLLEDAPADKKLHLYCDMDNMTAEAKGSMKFNNLNQAQDGRGLYKVRIWMQQGNTTDTTNIGPILEGTRGGDEIE